MRVDRLSIETSIHRAAYMVHVTTWDGLKGRLTHHGTYDNLSWAEMCQVVESTLDTLRPGTEFVVDRDQVVIQSPLFD